MAGVNYSNEKLGAYPIPEDGVSFGSISAAGITPYIKLGKGIYSGSYGFDTVTITLKGIQVPPYNTPTPATIGNATFGFRNRTWRVIDVQEGAKFNIGGQTRFSSWSVTGVDINTPRVKI